MKICFLSLSIACAVLMANFCAFGQVTFSKDWRPSGKRSINNLMMDSDYRSSLTAALGYMRLAEIRLQTLTNFPRLFSAEGTLMNSDGILNDFTSPYYNPPETVKVPH